MQDPIARLFWTHDYIAWWCLVLAIALKLLYVQTLLQICIWCWHHIMDMAEKDEAEGRCPACRTPYNKEKIVGMAANCERLTLGKVGEWFSHSTWSISRLISFVFYPLTRGVWKANSGAWIHYLKNICWPETFISIFSWLIHKGTIS